VDSSQPVPTATWNPARTVWETNQGSMLCGHLVPFLETFPTSGMTRSGRLFPLPQPERRTVGSASSYLPTPTAQINAPAPWKPDTAWWLQSRATRNLEGVVIGNTPLLPTPDSQHGRKDSRTSPLLPGAVESLLLPTPAANDSHNSPENHLRKKPGRTVVTSLQIIAENGLIETGGLLPTPSAGDGTGGHSSRSGPRRSERLLGGLARDLLPTPRAGMEPGVIETARARLEAGSPPRNTLEEEVSLLPTPTGGEAKSARNSTANRTPGAPARHSGDTLTDAILLPTPRSGHGMNDSMDSARTRLEEGARSRSTLEESVSMMPTPNSRDWKGSPSKAWSGQASLPRTTAQLSTGDSTPEPSSAGSLCSIDPLPGQLSLDLMAE